jgi:hypothetical protein
VIGYGLGEKVTTPDGKAGTVTVLYMNKNKVMARVAQGQIVCGEWPQDRLKPYVDDTSESALKRLIAACSGLCSAMDEGQHEIGEPFEEYRKRIDRYNDRIYKEFNAFSQTGQ